MHWPTSLGIVVSHALLSPNTPTWQPLGPANILAVSMWPLCCQYLIRNCSLAQYITVHFPMTWPSGSWTWPAREQPNVCFRCSSALGLDWQCSEQPTVQFIEVSFLSSMGSYSGLTTFRCLSQFFLEPILFCVSLAFLALLLTLASTALRALVCTGLFLAFFNSYLVVAWFQQTRVSLSFSGSSAGHLWPGWGMIAAWEVGIAAPACPSVALLLILPLFGISGEASLASTLVLVVFCLGLFFI